MNKEKEVFIVGGGPSLKNFDFNCLKDKKTITINMSIFDVPNPDYFITVDYTFLHKMRGFARVFSIKRCPKFFVVDLSYPYLVDNKVKCCVMDMRLHLKYNLSLFDIIIKARRKDGFGFVFDDFRTGMNSGYCALQLAILLGYTKIHLLGIDLIVINESHYHTMYVKDITFAEKLKKYYIFFKQGLEQLKEEQSDIEVISHSRNSLLNEIIEYEPLGDLLCP